MSLISSAPTLPLRASRSVSRVKPEMSTKTRVPVTRWCRSSGPVGAHSSSKRGTYGQQTVDRVQIGGHRDGLLPAARGSEV